MLFRAYGDGYLGSSGSSCTIEPEVYRAHFTVQSLDYLSFRGILLEALRFWTNAKLMGREMYPCVRKQPLGGVIQFESIL